MKRDFRKTKFCFCRMVYLPHIQTNFDGMNRLFCRNNNISKTETMLRQCNQICIRLFYDRIKLMENYEASLSFLSYTAVLMTKDNNC
jgi:hypothetical protein